MNNENKSTNKQEKKTIPIRDGLFTLPSLSQEPYLIGNKCLSCGEHYFPKAMTCHKCKSLKDGGLEEAKLSRYGKLYTYGIVRVAPVGFTAPYAIGYIDLPEGLRVWSLISECDYNLLKIGMDMKLVVEKIKEDENGNDVVCYKFKPIQSNEQKTDDRQTDNR